MTKPPTDFDILARNAAAINAEEEADEWVYLGQYDGVAEYRRRSKMTGGDHADRRNHLNRKLQERACRVVYEYGKDKP